MDQIQYSAIDSMVQRCHDSTRSTPSYWNFLSPSMTSLNQKCAKMGDCFLQTNHWLCLLYSIYGI